MTVSSVDHFALHSYLANRVADLGRQHLPKSKKMQSLNAFTMFLTAVMVAGLCNASPRFIQPTQLAGARAEAVAAAAVETWSPGLNTTLAANGTLSESISVTEAASATTDTPTSSVACIPMMMQVDYRHCGKRGG